MSEYKIEMDGGRDPPADLINNGSRLPTTEWSSLQWKVSRSDLVGSAGLDRTRRRPTRNGY